MVLRSAGPKSRASSGRRQPPGSFQPGCCRVCNQVLESSTATVHGKCVARETASTSLPPSFSPSPSPSPAPSAAPLPPSLPPAPSLPQVRAKPSARISSGGEWLPANRRLWWGGCTVLRRTRTPGCGSSASWRSWTCGGRKCCATAPLRGWWLRAEPGTNASTRARAAARMGLGRCWEGAHTARIPSAASARWQQLRAFTTTVCVRVCACVRACVHCVQAERHRTI